MTILVTCLCTSFIHFNYLTMGMFFLLTVLLFCGYCAFSQDRTVTGQVKDDKGNALSFATVTEAGTSNAVKADQNGNFSITVKPGARLTVTASGHQTQTLTANSN